MILLDTKAITEPVKLRPSPAALPWIVEHRPANLFLSASTLGEIDMGALLRERALQRLSRGPVRRHGVRDDRIAAAPVTTVLDKCVAIQGHTVWHETVAGMQATLDTFRLRYNRAWSHQGRGMNGRTPLQASLEGLPVRPEPQPENEPQPIAA